MVDHSPVFHILLQIEISISILAYPPSWTNSANMLSAPTNFPIFSALTAASTSRRIGLGCRTNLTIILFSTDNTAYFNWACQLKDCNEEDIVLLATA